jgi:tetratricopeptide (TPR) repeat protein
MDAAIDEYRKAIRLNPRLAVAHFNLANALFDEGAVDDAIAEWNSALRLNPNFAEAYCNLRTGLQRKWQFREALAAARRGHELGSRNPNWRYPSAQFVVQAERLVELDDQLTAVLRGEAKPSGVAEQIEFARLCQISKSQFAAAVRFYAEAFAAQPELATDLTKKHRYNAACAAALAGCGRGKDAGSIGEEEWARLRQQSLDWLRADLESWRKQFEGGSAEARAKMVKTLKHWQTDSDLAGVHDAEALAKLPEAEREAWGKLWADVAELLNEGSRD